MKLKIGLCQIDPSRRSPEEHVDWSIEQCRHASREGAALLLLPELFPFGPLPDKEAALDACGLVPGLISRLLGAARDYDITLCAGLPWRSGDGHIFNSQFITTSSGNVHRYDKLHLFPPFGEPEVFQPGSIPGSTWINLPEGELGLGQMICFDIRFPELARRYSADGCHLFMVSALWPLSRKDNFVALLKARAMENQCFLAASNACGRSMGIEFAGSSLVAGPEGKIYKQAGRAEGLIISEIDTARITPLRSTFNSAWPRGGWNFPAVEKLFDLRDLKKLAGRKKAAGQKMVFTNGCFDILHAGHVSYLKKARLFGDFLVLGLNSDSSVRSIKGQDRPINPQEHRALILSALSFVDFIVIFDEKTPERLIHELEPDVLVKGADWKEDEIVGASFVKSRGGRVERIKFDVDTSTSGIIRSIAEKT